MNETQTLESALKSLTHAETCLIALLHTDNKALYILIMRQLSQLNESISTIKQLNH